MQHNQLAQLTQKGLSLHQQGRLAEAQTIYEEILKIQANHFDALQLLGALLAQTQQLKKAVDLLTKALKINPNNAACYSNLGFALQALNRLDEALDSYDQAIRIKPDYAEAYYNRGTALQTLNRIDEALDSYDQAIRIKPDDAEAYSNRGNALGHLKRFDEALASYDQAIHIKPDYADAHSNRGNTLLELKRYEDALASYDKAIHIKPDLAEVHSNRGNALQNLKRLDEAIESYDQAISIKPEYYEALYNKAMLNLFLKKYQAGWENYDARLKTKDFQLKMVVEGLPLWNGSSCKHLLIFSEQGIGDDIFYASMLRTVIDRVEKITLSVDIRLLPILSRSFPEITFVDKNLPLDAGLYDAQIAFGSLPVVMSMNPNMFGRRVPYLVVNDGLKKTLINKPYTKKQLKCGVAWKSKHQKIGKDKSTTLSDLNDIFQVDGYEFINLQYGDTQAEIGDLEMNYGAKLTTISGIDLFKNIDGLLAIIQTCDLIVTTSNLTAHLAGALGKTTFLLVPYSVGRIWYWHEEANSSWYPSISLYFQDPNFEWHSAIKDIAARLKNELFK